MPYLTGYIEDSALLRWLTCYVTYCLNGDSHMDAAYYCTHMRHSKEKER
jgi:hypothetical protein